MIAGALIHCLVCISQVLRLAVREKSVEKLLHTSTYRERNSTIHALMSHLMFWQTILLGEDIGTSLAKHSRLKKVDSSDPKPVP
jgi:D-ribose pyranose/furanose isomerase RbsD